MTVGAVGLTVSSAQARWQPLVPRSGQALAGLLERVSQRVRQYYERAAVILCTERVSQQKLGGDLRSRGKARETIYELLMVRESEPSGADRDRGLRLERTLRSINGRAASAGDQPSCTDPKPASAEPLAFLLPDQRTQYRFSAAAAAPNGMLTLDFEQIASDPSVARWEGDCFTADGGRVRGRLWLDADTYDVRRLETRLVEPFMIVGSAGAGSALQMRVERSDTVVRLRPVAFQDPPETLLLPESVTTVTVIRGARVPRIRTVETFTDYRRFLSETAIRGGT
jgi:hypothetical protein